MSGLSKLSLWGTDMTPPYRGVCPVPLSSRLFDRIEGKAWCRPNAPVSVTDGNINLFGAGLLRFGLDVQVELFGPSSLAHKVSGIELHS
ncbi:hypothetical protein MCELHM10_04117 [Paracoccaceae bacterium]|jgi:hypothetical protein